MAHLVVRPSIGLVYDLTPPKRNVMCRSVCGQDTESQTCSQKTQPVR